MKYLSKDSMNDRNIYKKGKKPEKYSGKDLERRPLRNLFIDERDGDIAKIIWNYFDAVQERWPTAWWRVEREMILNRSTGFIALMNFFREAYLSFGRIGEVISKEDFKTLIDRVNIVDEEFNRENFLPGSGGQSKLFKLLKEQTNI